MQTNTHENNALRNTMHTKNGKMTYDCMHLNGFGYFCIHASMTPPTKIIVIIICMIAIAKATLNTQSTVDKLSRTLAVISEMDDKSLCKSRASIVTPIKFKSWR